MLPCPCGQKGRSISTGRFPVDESALCDCLASSSSPVPWSKKCAATESSRSRIVRSTWPRCLPSGSHSVGGRSRLAPSSTEFSGCLSSRICHAPTEPPRDSLRCFVLFFVSRCSRRRNASWMSSGRPMGTNIKKFPARCVEESRTSHVQHVVCETFPLSDRPQCSMSLRIPGAGRFDGSSIDPAHGSEKYRSFVYHS